MANLKNNNRRNSKLTQIDTTGDRRRQQTSEQRQRLHAQTRQQETAEKQDGIRLSEGILPMSVDFELAQHRYRRLALARRYTSLIDINTDRKRRRTTGKCKRSDGCTLVASSRVRSLHYAIFQPRSVQRL